MLAIQIGGDRLETDINTPALCDNLILSCFERGYISAHELINHSRSTFKSNGTIIQIVSTRTGNDNTSRNSVKLVNAVRQMYTRKAEVVITVGNEEGIFAVIVSAIYDEVPDTLANQGARF